MENRHAINSHPRTYKSSPEMHPAGASRAPGLFLPPEAWAREVQILANQAVSHFDAYRGTQRLDLFAFLTESAFRLALCLINPKKASADSKQSKRSFWRNPEKVIRALSHDVPAQIYRPHPIHTELIPKGDGTMRKLGLPCLRDKLIQNGLLLILDPILDRLFVDQSVGFRLGRRPQEAILRVRRAIEHWKTAWVIDVDIRDYFGSIPHRRLMAMITALTDRKTAELVGRILRSPVIESDGSRIIPTKGTPQGGILSPLLANLYLHHALDLWLFSIQNKFTGRIEFARYADDIIIVCERAEDARHLMPLIQSRLSSFGLEVNTLKSGFEDMTRPDQPTYREEAVGSFKFLGFNFKWVPDSCRAWRLQNAISDQSIVKSQLRFKRWIKMRPFDNSDPIGSIDGLGRRMAGFYGYYPHALDEDTPALARHNEVMLDLLLTDWVPQGLNTAHLETIHHHLAVDHRKDVQREFRNMERPNYMRQKASGLLPIETIPSPASSTADAEQMGKRFRC